jgi:glycosyltransferase involved in cell wall biosynthesis
MTRSRRYDVAFYLPRIAPLLARAVRPSPGGAETQVLLVSRALAARGVKVCLCSFDLPGGDLPPSLDGVDIVVRREHRSGQGMGARVRDVLETRRVLRDVDADVVITRTAGYHVGLVGIFARLARRRFVYSSANRSDFDFGIRSPGLRDRALYRLGVHLAHEIVVQTGEQLQLCEKRFRRPATVIANIVEPAPPRTAKPEAFLWVGRAVWYKRPLEYIELARALPEARFWMVVQPGPGSEDISPAIEKAAESVPNLEILPARPRPGLMNLIEQAVAVVNTSDFEGMPNVNLEGWARGVPALTLRYDPDGVIQRSGLGEFADGSSARFVEAARGLWEERADQGMLARRCREYIAQVHSEDVVAEQWQRALGMSAAVEPTGGRGA